MQGKSFPVQNSATGHIVLRDMLVGFYCEIDAESDRNWGRRENAGRFVGSRLREERGSETHSNPESGMSLKTLGLLTIRTE